MSEYYLVHHGIKGQKWGVRRFQNEDGSLTSEGYQRYQKDSKKLQRFQDRTDKYHLKTEQSLTRLKKKSRRSMTSDDSLVRTARKYRSNHKRYQQSLRRANRFYKKMEKQYMRELSPGQVDAGKRFIQMAVSDSSRRLRIMVEA